MILHDGLLKNSNSNVFQVTAAAGFPTFIGIDGNIDSQTLSMQRSFDNSNWDNLYDSSGAITLTAVGEQRRFELQPGYYRFFLSNGGSPDVDIYVSGRHVVLNP